MADPQIKCQLDAIDKLTVILYRSAMTAGSGLMSVAAWENDFAATGLIMAALIATTTVHIYDKRFRWLILGSALFAFSALAVKEYYCFKLKVLLITPLVLAGFWAGLVLSIPQLMIACSMAGAILLAVAAFSKWRMPLHYDIGDKSRYEV